MKSLRIELQNVICILLLYLLSTNKCYSQSVGSFSLSKKKLELADIKMWPTLGLHPEISSDGTYFMYEIKNQPVGSSTLVVRSTKGNWENRIVGVRLGFGKVYFFDNGKQLAYQKEDTLFFLRLGSSSFTKVISNVSDFSCPGSADNWVIYRTQKNKNQLIFYDFKTQKELMFPNTTGFLFDLKGNFLLVRIEEKDSSLVKEKKLKYLDIRDGVVATIWSGSSNCEDITLSENGDEVVFTVVNRTLKDGTKTENGDQKKSIWYFKKGMETAKIKIYSDFNNTSFAISGNPKFIENSDWLIFEFQKKILAPQLDSNAVKVKIWSYKDKIILPEQIRILNAGQKTYRAAINLITDKVVLLENDSDFLSFGPVGDFAIIKGQNFIDESWWSINASSPTKLLSLQDGKETVLKNDNISLDNFSFSPDKNWLVYYDKKKLSFFSCNLKTRKIISITNSIATSFQNESALEGSGRPVFGVVAWVAEGNSLLLYDNYDIWKVDPSGVGKAVNITNSYGKTNNLKLRLVYSNEVKFGTKKNIISASDTLLIVAFSPQNKHNGFFRKVLNGNGNPEKLVMGPYTFYRTESQKPHFWSQSDGIRPIKADSANVWIVSRETSNESMNYFFTENFAKFLPLTNVHPEKDYHWLTTQLITWKQLDGSMSQGILYKPENFDSTKKYPLLITYYEKMSHRLYEFPTPEFCTGDISISWFVTHDYLVFTPDIHYKIAVTSGKTNGECAFNSIVSAAQFLSKLPYIDKTKMGIEGHSFGGSETNYIITHTNLFAAACEFAGGSDPVSAYLTLVAFGAPFENFTKQSGVESGQGRLGATLWERPDLYLSQSTVLQANKISTPLLIAHNEQDNNIPWRQGLELYMALRRLGKKVWMLQYEDVHNLHIEKNAIDFTIRLTQFFDHYLKNQSAPKWMTDGIPPNLIGKINGYELDIRKE